MVVTAWRARPLASAHPWVITVCDGLYHRLQWVWSAVVVSIIASGFLSTYLATGAIDFTTLAQWPIFAWLLAHLFASGGLLVMLALVTLAGFLAHPHAHDAAVASPSSLLFRGRDIRLDNVLFKQGAHPVAAYFPRAPYTVLRGLLKTFAAGASPTLGAVLIGPMLVGKTRLALEALRAELPNHTILLWPHGGVAPTVLATVRGRAVLVLVDDWHTFTAPTEVTALLSAVETLRQTAHPFLLATCRGGTDVDAVHTAFRGLFDLVTPIPLAALSDAEADQFLAFAQTAAQHDPQLILHPAAFDGMPGSLLLDVQRRTDQFSAPDFPAPARAILQTLRLLRGAQIYQYPQSLVRQVAVGVFALAPTQWEDAQRYLVHNDWLRLSPGDATGESTLAVLSDAYLDTCVAASYPLAPRRIPDDFPRLVQALQTPPVAEALFAVSGALRDDPLGDKAEQIELALHAVQVGLADVDRTTQPERWADGNVWLGNAYRSRIRGEQADNVEEAIACFQRALEVSQRAAFSVDWATTQLNLGNAYGSRIRGERADNVEEAIACYLRALEVRTHAAFPVDWARTTYNLALTQAEVATLAREQGDTTRCAQAHQQALDLLQAVLEFFTAPSFPQEYHKTQATIAAITAHRCEP